MSNISKFRNMSDYEISYVLNMLEEKKRAKIKLEEDEIKLLNNLRKETSQRFVTQMLYGNGSVKDDLSDHLLIFNADDCNDDDWDDVIKVLKANLKDFQVFYADGNYMNFRWND